MGIDFYYVPGSAPCRNVLLAAKALNVNLNLKLVDMASGEHLKPEYIKINPQHTVPTLVDDGFTMSESRAMIMYLANKYAKGSSFYPEEPKARAQVDQKLFFDIGTLYQRLADYYYGPLFYGTPANEAAVPKIDDAFKVLNSFLEGQKFAAGDNLTLADLSLVATVSTYEALDYDFSKYTNVVEWYKRVKATAPGYKEANADGIEAFKGLVKHLRSVHKK